MANPKKTEINDDESIHQENELKQLKDEIVDLENKLNFFFDNFPDMAFQLDFHSLKLIKVNDTLCRKLGYSREELLAKDPMELLDLNSKKIFQNRIKQLLNGQQPSEWIEYTGYTKEGKQIIGEFNILFTYEKGKPRGAIVVAHDITRLKNIEASIIENSNLLNSILEGIPDPIFVKDLQSRIILGNSGLEKLVGKPLDQIIGRAASEYYDDPEIGHRLREHDLQVIRSKAHIKIEEIIPKPEGNLIFLQIKHPITT